MVQNTDENREKLATEVVDSWDFDTLWAEAVRRIEADYAADDELFQSDWENEFGDE